MWKSLTVKLALCAAGAALSALPVVAQAQNIMDQIKQRGTLVVGVKADYKPYGFRDPAGKIVGIEPDLAQDVATKLGVKLELVPVVSSNRMQFLDQGKIDLMIATMNDKPDRRKVVYIVEPSYYASMTNVLTLKSNKLKDWNELKGKKVCMIQGAWYNKKLQEDYGLDALAFKGTAEAFSALKSNNCVAFAYDDTFILASLLEPEWKDYEMPLKSILEDPWGLAVKLGEENFYKFMSEMVKEWHRSGRIVALEKKYGMANTGYALQMQAQFNKK
jgi:polar amino acid transport system substrate-binding protein